jgi:salicylate hydroxylase
VHRAHFLDVLVKLIPEGVAKFGKRVENVEKRGQEILLTFHDGSTAVADAVIGCDGVKSRTRQILLGENHQSTNPTFTGKYAYRGLIPMEKAANALGDELARNSQMYLGRHGHVLTFPIEKGKTMNVVAFQTKKDGKWDDERWVLPMKKEDMFADFEGWGDSVQNILSVSRGVLKTCLLIPNAPSLWKNPTSGPCSTTLQPQPTSRDASHY